MLVVSTDDDEEEDSDEDLFMSSLSSNKKKKKPPTLEEMILQLEMEEQTAARKSIRNSNTDILASARNQYPRFSLDGKDALYRSSFRNLDHPTPARHSVCCDGRERLMSNYKKKLDHHVKLGMPGRLAGENVVWCNPGVIGKLMGLDAMPIPINNSKETMLNSIRINTSSFHRHHTKFDCRSGRPTMRRSMPLYSSNYRNRNCTINTRYSLN
ncbi:hypothetical protein M5689_010445 [Euphorbia peplus]|nr:hypothetical protein M5689_010445 [Euphorbia peplus]